MKYDLNDIVVFRAVAKSGQFTLAAQRLGVPKSFVSRKISDLEERLGLRLFERTTRRVRLTEDGERYYSVCDRALEEIDEIERSFEESHAEPRGRLRITCPVEFGPALTQFLADKYIRHYPGVTVEILASNTVYDLVKDQVDVAIRPIRLADPSMISLRLGDMEWAFYASQSYLSSQKARIRNPEDLTKLDVIGFNPTSRVKSGWKILALRGHRQMEVNFDPVVAVTSLSSLGEAVASGLGVAALPTYVVKEQLQGRQIERVLPDWIHQRETLAAVYSSTRHLPSRVRVFLELLKKHKLLGCV